MGRIWNAGAQAPGGWGAVATGLQEARLLEVGLRLCVVFEIQRQQQSRRELRWVVQRTVSGVWTWRVFFEGFAWDSGV